MSPGNLFAQTLRRNTLPYLLGAGGVVLAGALALVAWGVVATAFVFKALALWALTATFIGYTLGSSHAHPHTRFGPANGITLLRLSLVLLMAALVGEVFPATPIHATPVAAWALVVVATVTALLDAVDGHLARKTGLASAWGARFDMETDAFYILVLCLLVVQAGQAGPWILASGLMRYAFVLSARLWPWLSGPLAPSRRRQTVCVVQVTALIICLGPIVPVALAQWLAASSLALLCVSFGIDIRALARQQPQWKEQSP
ncbi:MAG: CDP-alcohol phosphatidyltransferase family protein [Hydrogenophaga sp.]|jgi:phosphatidylglycerophosphate synthase|nr:CDP-alcohol phosphatidyltransferase family protein [Hydrogenophaga sp.]